MSMIYNPHDKFFKENMSNIDTAKDFMLNYLPEDILKIIDLDSLSLEKDSFIDEKYLFSKE
jgi:predicted transposase YdaD